MPTPLRLDDLLALDANESRARATWVYGALRYFLDVPASLRTDRVVNFTEEIDSHPRSAEIREIFHEFWSHHSYIRVILEAGMPEEVFLLRELLRRSGLIGAVVLSIAMDRIWNAIAGHPFLTPEEAEHGVHMFLPLHSLTIPFAIITGVFLWLSSLATGWTANYVAITRVESAIAHSLRIRRRLGPKRGNAIAHWMKHHATGSVGYIVLGFLLGSVPILFSLFGIPLEARHVALNAASLTHALDAARLEGQLHSSDVVLTFTGILSVGALNIFTSFCAQLSARHPWARHR